MRFQKIVVAIDDSPLCPSVFSAALELAYSNQATLMLLNCLTPEWVSEQAIPMSVDTGVELGFTDNDFQTQQFLIDKQIEQQMEDGQTLLKSYCEEAMSRGVAIESDYKPGEVGHQLCETAKEWGADLIVVGRRGLTGLAEALLGSVSNYVVHHAPCSVLVIQEVETEPPAEAVRDVS